MSALPRYSKTPNLDESETEGLFKGDRTSLDNDDVVDGLTAYPPRPGGSSTSGLHNVTYIFEPDYPVKGNRQRVLGVLGRDREVSPGVNCVLINERGD